MSDCAQMSELYESYALGALEGPECAELEAHLARGCPRCTSELERARWLVAQLGYLAPEAEPSPALRRRILDSVGRLDTGAKKIVPRWGWAAIAALLLLALLSTLETRRYQQEIAALRTERDKIRAFNEALEADRELYQRASAILSAPATKETKLSPGQRTLPEFRAFWHPRLGLLLAGTQISPPPSGRTLQLWLVPKRGNPVSAGVFRPDTEGRVLMITTPGAERGETAALAISDEPLGGSPQPTTKPTWVGPLS